MPQGRTRFKFLVVGFGDSTVRVLSLEPESCLARVSMQALPQNPTSLSLCEISDQLHLHIGLENGVLLRTVIDTITGNLSDSRSKFLGLKPIKLCKLKVKNRNAVLALSTKPHLCYDHLNQY